FEDPKVGVRGDGEGATDGRKHPVGPETADGGNGPERHVHGMGGEVGGARRVRHAGSAPRRRLPSGAAPTPAPGTRRGEGQLHGATGHELDSANNILSIGCQVGRKRASTWLAAVMRDGRAGGRSRR